MATHKCVWLDHEKAYIVTNDGENEKLETINSNADLRERYPGETNQGSRFGNQSVIKEKSKKARLIHQFNKFYQSIIVQLKDADVIHLIGPSNAKQELGKLITNNTELNNKLKDILVSDKLTENQLMAKARELSV